MTYPTLANGAIFRISYNKSYCLISCCLIGVCGLVRFVCEKLNLTLKETNRIMIGLPR